MQNAEFTRQSDEQTLELESFIDQCEEAVAKAAEIPNDQGSSDGHHIPEIEAFLDPLLDQLDTKLAETGPALTNAKNMACDDLQFEADSLKGKIDNAIAFEV